MASGTITLRIKCKKNPNLRTTVAQDATISDFLTQLTTLTDIPSSSMVLKKDFPPKRITFANDNDPVSTLGLRHQDSLIIEMETGLGANTNSGPPPPALDIADFNLGEENGPLMRKVVEADNSCLFSSIIFCLRETDTIPNADYLRQVIATTVEQNQEQYSEAFLGRKNTEYSSWIRKKESWGGAIEVAILSERYQCEIVVINVQTANLSRFGEDKSYNRQIYLIYDGIHYDPLYLETAEGGKRTIFSPSDEQTVSKAIQLAQEAKASHQFTDLTNFRLKCTICGIFLRGEIEAQAHAKSTGHASFSEVHS